MFFFYLIDTDERRLKLINYASKPQVGTRRETVVNLIKRNCESDSVIVYATIIVSIKFVRICLPVWARFKTRMHSLNAQ